MAVQVRARPVGWPAAALMQTRFHVSGAIAGFKPIPHTPATPPSPPQAQSPRQSSPSGRRNPLILRRIVPSLPLTKPGAASAASPVSACEIMKNFPAAETSGAPPGRTAALLGVREGPLNAIPSPLRTRSDPTGPPGSRAYRAPKPWRNESTTRRAACDALPNASRALSRYEAAAAAMSSAYPGSGSPRRRYSPATMRS